MVKGNLKKLVATEWVMFWIFGLFWAGVMFLPLYVTGSFDTKADYTNSLLILCGPYLLYIFFRLFVLICRSLGWAYLASNLFFRNNNEKHLADEWFRFVLFVFFWALIMAYPMYLAGLFTENFSWKAIAAIVMGPYALYLFSRTVVFFVRTFVWAFRTSISKK